MTIWKTSRVVWRSGDDMEETTQTPDNYSFTESADHGVGYQCLSPVTVNLVLRLIGLFHVQSKNTFLGHILSIV